MTTKTLNLLMIDEEQLYAERLVGLLSSYYEDVNLGFLDDKEELKRVLRQEWDVLVFHRAYDLTFTDVVGILQELQIELPVICLATSKENSQLNSHGLPEVMHGDMVKSLLVGHDEAIVTTICLQADYSRAKRHIRNMRLILKEAEQRANVLIKNSKSAVAYIDQGVHVFANEPYLEMFGYKAMEDIIGVPVVDLIAGGDSVKGFKQFLRKFDKGDRSQVEFAFESKRTDGTTFASKLQLASATLDGEPVVQMIIQQTGSADSEELERRLAEAERQDPLTGLMNRLGIETALNETHQSLKAGELKVSALIYVRMDGIGNINSSTGITGVDTSIKQIAYLLDEQFKKAGDVSISRFRDSTFAVIINNKIQADVVALCQKIADIAKDLFIEVGSRTVTTTLSMGIVMMDKHSPDTQVLLERAIETTNEIDIDSSDDKVAVFDISKVAGTDDGAMAEFLQNALVNNSLQLSYQPIYDIETDSSDLFEVFISLPQANGTELSYGKLMPIAKQYNLLDKLDRWMLINASKHLAQIRQMHPNTRLLIGLSSTTLEDSTLPNIITQLNRAIGGGSDVLTLQFSEQDLVDYMAVAKRQFMALSSIGCHCGVYDFGSTAKTSEVLEHLSPYVARLARSYTKDLDRESNLNTTQSLVQKANEHNTSVLMPYIGDAATMSMAWSVGAKFLQGDYLQPATTTITFPAPAEA